MTIKKGYPTKKLSTRLKKFFSKSKMTNRMLDQLSEKVKKLSSLVSWCREKLHNTEEEIEKILKEIEKS